MSRLQDSSDGVPGQDSGVVLGSSDSGNVTPPPNPPNIVQPPTTPTQNSSPTTATGTDATAKVPNSIILPISITVGTYPPLSSTTLDVALNVQPAIPVFAPGKASL